MSEDSIQRIPLGKQVPKKKKNADIIDISSDEVFISMDPPMKKAQNTRERTRTRKSTKAKRKCRCK